MKRAYQIFFSDFANSWVILAGCDADILPISCGYHSAQEAFDKVIQFVGNCHVEVLA